MGWTRRTDMLTFTEIALEPKLAVSHSGRAMRRMRDFACSITSLGATLQSLNCTRNRDPYPRLGERQLAGIESPRPRSTPGTLNHVGQGFRPPGLALHGYRRLHLGEGAAPSPTGYTGDRDDP